jgi:hypothetical protein
MMWEGKLVAAAVENSGAIIGHLDYAFEGSGDTRAIVVSATRRGETNPRTVTVTLKEARTANEMWKRQPDQQLVYHGARVWARRWTPAVILGVYSREEMGPIIEAQIVTDEAETPAAPPVQGDPDARSLGRRAVPVGNAPGGTWEPAQAPRAQGEEAPPITDRDKYLGPKFMKWYRELEIDIAQAQSRLGLDAIGERSEVKNVLAAAGESTVQSERATMVVNLFQAAIDGLVLNEGPGLDPGITAADRWSA